MLMRVLTSRRRWIACSAAIIVSAACASARSGTAAGELGSDEWRLSEVGGRSALPTDVARRPSLRFAPDSGQASGNAGCNRFAGPFTRNGSSITFGALMSTRMACADNAMNQQEQAYLSALQSTDHYEISGNTLTLLRGSERLARLIR